MSIHYRINNGNIFLINKIDLENMKSKRNWIKKVKKKNIITNKQDIECRAYFVALKLLYQTFHNEDIEKVDIIFV